MKHVKSALLGLLLAGVAATAAAQNEQYFPLQATASAPTPPAAPASSAGSSTT